MQSSGVNVDGRMIKISFAYDSDWMKVSQVLLAVVFVGNPFHSPDAIVHC